MRRGGGDKNLGANTISISMEGYLSEQTSPARIIFVSTPAVENGQLIFDNSAGVINSHSEIALHSVQTTQTTPAPGGQSVSVLCSSLSTIDRTLRHFFVTHTATHHSTTEFNNLYFRPVDTKHERIYFECSNTGIQLVHIVLLHRYRS